MKKIDTNRINMLTTLSGVLDKHEDAWKDHGAFSENAADLKVRLGLIDEQAEIAEGASGASEAKKLAREALGQAAVEIIGAVSSYAVKNGDAELAAKVRYAPSDVVAGKASEVVARCRAIYTAANGVIANLAKFGITPAKLAAFKKKIDAFDEMKTAPREDAVGRSAAILLLPTLVRAAVSLARDEMDGLMPQFKESAPNFYEEYFAARVIVNIGGNPADTDADNATSAPSAPAPLAKAA